MELNATEKQVEDMLSDVLYKDDVKENVKKVFDVIEKEEYDVEDYPVVDEWIRDCYNSPKKYEIILAIMNEILQGWGIGHMRKEGVNVSRYFNDIICVYVELGNSYCLTVCFDTDLGVFEICSTGDFWENWRKNHSDIVEA